MGRKYMECHMQDFPGATRCTTTLTAENEEMLLEEAIRHAVNVHGMANTESFRDTVRKEFRDAPLTK